MNLKRMLERASFNRSNNFKNNIDHGKKTIYLCQTHMSKDGVEQVYTGLFSGETIGF